MLTYQYYYRIKLLVIFTIIAVLEKNKSTVHHRVLQLILLINIIICSLKGFFKEAEASEQLAPPENYEQHWANIRYVPVEGNCFDNVTNYGTF